MPFFLAVRTSPDPIIDRCFCCQTGYILIEEYVNSEEKSLGSYKAFQYFHV
ncbi:hypothetical protein HMPREF0083_02160 [Aneurinibacillus aneurinilyticus ATCC 12856]|uniref:Uncharacterized protein n=1 Tax=Aneurinibacillus aneurinilyticus ATCC 12856 TaxID=649747 RepID=U1X4B0_ANEAE|nr:hypothetical protein HMPREF0083_02160 [Aneurinibacillus aneurinilyticus ATCC 12856]